MRRVEHLIQKQKSTGKTKMKGFCLRQVLDCYHWSLVAVCTERRMYGFEVEVRLGNRDIDYNKVGSKESKLSTFSFLLSTLRGLSPPQFFVLLTQLIYPSPQRIKYHERSKIFYLHSGFNPESPFGTMALPLIFTFVSLLFF